MRLVILCHPPTLGSTSMPRFARMIGEEMRGRGHAVEYWTSPHHFGRLPLRSGAARKWLGYLDQFLLFPPWLRLRAAMQPRGTLFVIADQALGPWVPAIRHHPHVIHCHDFLAQRSARGEIPENPTGWSGRKYQALIRRGYRMGRAFASVSANTRDDLHRFLQRNPEVSEVIYNPFNHPFTPLPRPEALAALSPWSDDLAKGFVVHIGGDQWYKNRPGVLLIYRAYVESVAEPLPLVMIGRPPGDALRDLAATIDPRGRVIFVPDWNDAQVQAAYSVASVLLFPSLEEGFGWPIAEAQACGCPVLTTGVAPMTEVGGDAAVYLQRRVEPVAEWAEQAARKLAEVLALDPTGRAAMVAAGLVNVRRFDDSLDRIESLYHRLITAA